MEDHLETSWTQRAFSVNAMASLVGGNSLENRQARPFHEIRASELASYSLQDEIRSRGYLLIRGLLPKQTGLGPHLFRQCHVPKIHRSEKEMESSRCARDRSLTCGSGADVYSSSNLPIDFPTCCPVPVVWVDHRALRSQIRCSDPEN